VRYQIKGFTIRSENAAKPAKQASGYLVQLLKEFRPIDHALDFGCGKLRYAVHLQKIARRLTLVDSETQLSRTQVVIDRTTSVRAYVALLWRHTRTLNVVDFGADKSKFDFILCANVLSAIPSITKRRQIVRALSQKLRRKGRCLFVCQYTNSDFFRQLADQNVKKHADGYIKGAKQNASFYGLINLPLLRGYVEKAGMVIEKAWVNDQSAYVVGLSR
jgi:predicted TPR repeat methyltransferase